MKTWLKPVLIGSVSNLRFIIEVPNISLPHLEAWSHIKAWSEKITFEIEAPASIRGNTVKGSWLRQTKHTVTVPNFNNQMKLKV